MKTQDKLIIRKPTLLDKEQVLEMVEEFRKYDSVLNGHGSIDKCASYEEWLEKLAMYENKETLPKDRVLATQYITVRESDNKIVGLINARWQLNTFLMLHGGHIGDSIRPLERNKGYATEQIRLLLEEFKKRGEKKVLITCKKTNIASARSIEKNGGVFENEVEYDGDTYRRYWITF